ncbi:MAG: 3-oxoacyl-ACP reductase [Chromatiales bacterium RIFOXYA1_FULL_46_5]|nr:MAG: 3-oxoacyl-ACP reductase [Chromatiales bacterium RIFOXYA1_FULL_46_5]
MTSWVNSLLGSAAARWCGVPQATALQRPQGEEVCFSGSVLLCGKPSEHSLLLRQHLSRLPAIAFDTGATEPLQAIIFDGTALQSTTELDLVWQQLQSALPRLVKNGRLLILASVVAEAKHADAAAAAAALSGFTRSIAKELGRFGSTANLVSVHQGVQQSLLPVAEFFLSKASAYITGQMLAVHAAKLTELSSWQKPLQGKTALVTGAARGIGAAIAKTLAEQGAVVIGLDMPQTQDALHALMQQLQGKSLLLDISQASSAETLSDWLTQQDMVLDILVHNAGITRDKLFHRMTQAQWSQTLEVNLRAVQRITSQLLEQQQIQAEGRVVLLSSMNGLAGQKGQTNYASSKAALAGYCQFMAGKDNRGITFNAVAPGFIETQMTAAMPFIPREVGRRLNSLHQAGLPEDVASAVAFFSRPDAVGLNGSVLRVCGQCVIGA